MKDGPNIVGIAALVGERARADILTALMAGHALTATELAQVAEVTKQTMSAHLAKLVEARLVCVERQGRHRYFRLADADVAHLLESLMGVAYRTGALRARASPREPALRKARVCYDHLAGELGVAAHDGFARRKLLERGRQDVRLTPEGERFCRRHGLAIEATTRRAPCRVCLDWSERRHHLAGALGAALLQHCFDAGWARRERGTRVVRFSAAGERALLEAFG
jgi:DNA-binding transcriptional ArsR family regulator